MVILISHNPTLSCSYCVAEMCRRVSCKTTWFYWTLEMEGSCFFSSCRHDGLIILATNRPYDLDEAMHRRIMIAIEFRQPDHLLRKTIWQSHMPEQMKVNDIDLVSQETLSVFSGILTSLGYICCVAWF